MTQAAFTVERARIALQPLCETMKADGYVVVVEPGDGSLRLRIEAQADACADCLVPKPIFASLVEQALRDAGETIPIAPIELVYPADVSRASS